MVITNCCALRNTRAPVDIIYRINGGDLNAPDGHVNNEIAMSTMYRYILAFMYIILWVYVYNDMSNGCDIYTRMIVV